jgi:MFS family permease
VIAGRGAERALIATVALGAILAPLNSTMIAVALPRIIADFDTTVGTAGWLVTSYLLALAVVQPVAGKLGDRHGRRAFILGGLATFGVASLGAALASSLAALIAFRVLQAVAGAVVFPNGAGLIRELIPAERRGGAFGLVGACLAVAAGTGPLLGGLLVRIGGWDAIFVVNLPLVALALAVAWKGVPVRARGAAGMRTAFDWAGALLLAVVLCGVAAVVI